MSQMFYSNNYAAAQLSMLTQQNMQLNGYLSGQMSAMQAFEQARIMSMPQNLAGDVGMGMMDYPLVGPFSPFYTPSPQFGGGCCYGYGEPGFFTVGKAIGNFVGAPFRAVGAAINYIF